MFDNLFSLNNLFKSWKKFRRGKSSKADVLNFELHLEDNLFQLYNDLHGNTYSHSLYEFFQIFDNKKRNINKAKIRDRIVHQVIYDYLLSLFEPEFITDSYASRVDKGQYKAINAFRYFIKLAQSKNKKCLVLKCDINKYFDSIDHNILINFIEKKVNNSNILRIIKLIINSYNSNHSLGKGIPLGNITSQIFANIYLDALDKYVKNELRCRYYVRYNDDLIIVSHSNERLVEIRNKIINFVGERLLLEIPLGKTSIRKINWGVDFLGYTILPKAMLLRNKTKNKLYSNINTNNIHSYLGILKHGDANNLKRKIISMEKLNETW